MDGSPKDFKRLNCSMLWTPPSGVSTLLASDVSLGVMVISLAIPTMAASMLALILDLTQHFKFVLPSSFLEKSSCLSTSPSTIILKNYCTLMYTLMYANVQMPTHTCMTRLFAPPHQYPFPQINQPLNQMPEPMKDLATSLIHHPFNVTGVTGLMLSWRLP